MLVVATETFYHNGRLIRPNHTLEVSASVANDLMVGGFVKETTPSPLNVETETLIEPTTKKSRTTKK